MYVAFDAAAKADLAAHAVEEQLSKAVNADLSAQLAPFTSALKSVLDGSGADPSKHVEGVDAVTGAAGQIYGEFDMSDEPPTQALLTAATQTEADSKAAVGAWKDFQANQLPALNEVLRKAGKPAINLTQQPTDLPEAGDED